VGSNKLFISCHVLGSVDAMLRFIHAVGSLKLAVLVPVYACTQQIILVFICGMYVPTLAYLWYLVMGNITRVVYQFGIFGRYSVGISPVLPIPYRRNYLSARYVGFTTKPLHV